MLSVCVLCPKSVCCLFPFAPDPGPLRGGLPSQSWGAARAQRPPLTRVKLGAMVTLPGQHELSVIQEVETPGERSLTATGEGLSWREESHWEVERLTGGQCTAG